MEGATDQDVDEDVEEEREERTLSQIKMKRETHMLGTSGALLGSHHVIIFIPCYFIGAIASESKPRGLVIR